jgi:2,3-bisphosphoglycerate-independent phosphoglycerate mutase
MTATVSRKTPHVLVILDGIGHRDDVKDNAYLAANTPNLDAIKAQHPNGLISGSGEDVGLPEGQFGNSEVGHMNLGAGRVLYQDSTKITKEIREGQFFEHPVLLDAIEQARGRHGALHILGLLSDGGVHAHIDHLVAMSSLAAQNGLNVLVHAFWMAAIRRPKVPRNTLIILKPKWRLKIPKARDRFDWRPYVADILRWIVMSAGIAWKKPTAC